MAKLLGLLYIVCRPGIYLLLHRSRRTRVVIRYKDEVLMVRSLFGEQKWGLPGGGIKRHETADQSAVRETHEETGIILDQKRLRFLTTKRSGFGGLNWPYVTLLFYEYRLRERPRSLTLQWFEVSEYQWFNIATVSSSHTIDSEIVTVLNNWVQ